MAGSLNVLGLGSNVLTNDVLDKLKKVDTDTRIKPFEVKLKSNEARQTDFNIIKEASHSLKSITAHLSSEVNYLQRDVKLNGSSVSVTAESGTNTQSFQLDVTQLAKRDIYESKNLASETTTLGAGTLDIAVDGKSYSITVDAATSVKDLKDSIYEKTDGKVTASLLNVGGTEPYKLILKSTDTGLKNALTISGTTATELNIGTAIQSASDAQVSYNGVNITRSENSITDLIPGVKININELGKTTVNIQQTTSNVSDKVKDFVNKYNELLTNIQTVTDYNSETKKSGSFQGNNDMNSISRMMRNIVNLDTDGSLSKFGITAGTNGKLNLDETKLNNALKNDFDSAKKFLVGDSEEKGFFQKVNTQVTNLTTDDNGILKNLEDQLKLNKTNLTKDMKQEQEKIETKFEIMQRKFAAYDALISKLNANFSALKSIIDAQNSQKQ